MHVTRRVLSTVCVGALALGGVTTPVYADYWSCGNRVVSSGQTKSEVMIVCGEPSWKDRHTEEHYEKRDGNVVGGSVEHETWVYNPGPSQLIRILVFNNGELMRIDTGERGFLVDDSSSKSCRPEELHVGQDKYLVWSKCGEPAIKDERVEKRVRGGRDDNDVFYINVDEWTYNLGPQRFMRLLRFENGTLVDIRELTRGR